MPNMDSRELSHPPSSDDWRSKPIKRIGSQSKQDVINKLRELKLDLVDGISLPQIAVCGNQSVGKSTVMSALSGIPFPTGSKLTTRCATQVTMMSHDVFQVTVGLSDSPKLETLDSLDAVANAIEEKTSELTKHESEQIETDRFIKISVQVCLPMRVQIRRCRTPSADDKYVRVWCARSPDRVLNAQISRS